MKGDAVMLGDHRIEDVRWLCSLSESELDLLISLKKMARQRARFTDHKSLADKFDLKMLRGLSCVLMEYLKGQLKESGIPEVAESSSRCVEGSKLLRREISEEFRDMGAEELMRYIRSDKKKRVAELFGEDFVPRKKNRTSRGRTL